MAIKTRAARYLVSAQCQAGRLSASRNLLLTVSSANRGARCQVSGLQRVTRRVWYWSPEGSVHTTLDRAARHFDASYKSPQEVYNITMDFCLNADTVNMATSVPHS